MRPFILITILLIGGCYCLRKEKFPTQDDTAILKQLEHDAIAAEFAMDTAGVSKVMDDQFINVSGNAITSKQAELAFMFKNFEQRKQQNHIIDSFYLDHFRVDYFDNTAIVTFHIVTKGMENNKPYENKRTMFYDVWVKRNGKWKLVSMHATKINY